MVSLKWSLTPFLGHKFRKYYMKEKLHGSKRRDLKVKPLRILWILLAGYLFVLVTCLGGWVAIVGYQKVADIQAADLFSAMVAISVPVLAGYAGIIYELWRGKFLDLERERESDQ